MTRPRSWQLPDQHGRTVSLADFGGGPLLVYFLPQGRHPGVHPAGVQSIRDAREELRDTGPGGGGHQPRSSRPGSRSSMTNTAWPSPSWRTRTTGWPRPTAPGGEKTLYGKKAMGIIRSSFLIDARGKDRGGLVRGQAGRHGPQGPKGVARPRIKVGRSHPTLFYPKPPEWPYRKKHSRRP